MSRVLVNNLSIRDGPSTSCSKLGSYNEGEVIKSGDQLIQNEGRTWLRYYSSKGDLRYVCAIDNNGSKYIDFPSYLGVQSTPAPANFQQSEDIWKTGLRHFPLQKDFPIESIRKSGCCFLCTCVKGGLTTQEECLDCYNWAVKNKIINPSDCYINVEKNRLSEEIANRYGTTFHSDYVFQKSPSPHFYLTQNGIEIFNSAGIGYR